MADEPQENQPPAVKIFGKSDSARAYTIHDFLHRGDVPFEWVELHTEWAAAAGVARDSDGYLVTGPDLQLDGGYTKSWPLERAPFYLESNVPGLFAAGDVRHGSVKRCASAVGEGAMAVTFVHRYLS